MGLWNTFAKRTLHQVWHWRITQYWILLSGSIVQCWKAMPRRLRARAIYLRQLSILYVQSVSLKHLSCDGCPQVLNTAASKHHADHAIVTAALPGAAYKVRRRVRFSARCVGGWLLQLTTIRLSPGKTETPMSIQATSNMRQLRR